VQEICVGRNPTSSLSSPDEELSGAAPFAGLPGRASPPGVIIAPSGTFGLIALWNVKRTYKGEPSATGEATDATAAASPLAIWPASSHRPLTALRGKGSAARAATHPERLSTVDVSGRRSRSHSPAFGRARKMTDLRRRPRVARPGPSIDLGF